MKRNTFNPILLLVSLIIFISQVFPESVYCSEVTVLFTGNSLGQVTPVINDKGNETGGAVRVAEQIYSERTESKNVILLDAGNALGPNILVRESKGLDQVTIMNLMGYQAMAIGEMELMYGPESLENAIKRAEFPLLSVNLLKRESRKPLTKSHTIITSGDLKIGVIGVTDPDIPVKAYGFEDCIIEDPAYLVSELADDLKQKDKCDLIFVLSNLGPAKDQETFQSISTVDAVIGASLRHSPTDVYSLIPQDIRKGIALIYITPLNTSLGKVMLEIKRDSEKIKIDNIKLNSIYLDKKSDSKNKSKQVNELESIIKNDIFEKTSEKRQYVLSTISKGDSVSVSTLVLESMLYSTPAELAIIDRGLFGWFPNEINLKTRISRLDIEDSILYGDKIILVRLSGDKIQNLLDRSEDLEGTEKELLFSQNFDTSYGTINGRDLDDDEEYLVAVNNYIAYQGAGYTDFEDAKLVRDTNIKIKDAVFEYLKYFKSRSIKLNYKELEKKADHFHWKYKLELDLNLSSHSISEDAELYDDDTNASQYSSWGAGFDFKLIGYSEKNRVELKIKPDYKETRQQSEYEEDQTLELQDELDALLEYKRYFGKILFSDLFFKLENYEFVPEEDSTRNGSLSHNLGLGFKFSEDFDCSLGGSMYDQIFEDDLDSEGLYFKLNYDASLDFLDMDLELELYAYYILKHSPEDPYQFIIPPQPVKGDYKIDFQGELNLDITDWVSLELEPHAIYKSNVNKWGWELDASISIDLALGNLE